jgi:hypothetical protein
MNTKNMIILVMNVMAGPLTAPIAERATGAPNIVTSLISSL